VGQWCMEGRGREEMMEDAGYHVRCNFSFYGVGV